LDEVDDLTFVENEKMINFWQLMVMGKKILIAFLLCLFLVYVSQPHFGQVWG
jgi:hypothetical protein